MIEDLTAVKTAEVHTRVLAESGRILASSLDYEQTLRNVARVAVPELADWCIVELVDERLRRQTVVVAHRDAEREALVGQLRAFEPDESGPDSASGRVFRTGAARAVLRGPRRAPGRAAPASEEHLRLLRELGDPLGDRRADARARPDARRDVLLSRPSRCAG